MVGGRFSHEHSFVAKTAAMQIAIFSKVGALCSHFIYQTVRVTQFLNI